MSKVSVMVDECAARSLEDFCVFFGCTDFFQTDNKELRIVHQCSPRVGIHHSDTIDGFIIFVEDDTGGRTFHRDVVSSSQELFTPIGRQCHALFLRFGLMTEPDLVSVACHCRFVVFCLFLDLSVASKKRTLQCIVTNSDRASGMLVYERCNCIVVAVAVDPKRRSSPSSLRMRTPFRTITEHVKAVRVGDNQIVDHAFRLPVLPSLLINYRYKYNL
mmetsp:Transcript_48390/g.117155  ORF Transcript_48390/g.117155 Transcript_48390/m.117155 type:complete len:217 (+) Transcript_48390:959-1609(+)